MPADFFIDVGSGVVFSKAIGVLTRADILRHREGLLHHPAFRPTFNQLLDFREVTRVALSGEQIRELAQRTVFSAHSMRAFVASSEELYGVGRMFSIYREIEGEAGVKIYREMNGALSWLSLSAEPDSRSFSNFRE